ncbi:hypothetical protein OXPF_16210 [Oxobacter pfennigii]|uniref:Cyclic lactone autoinducer peptide n=1 Tax=Oxobacter pfennigii TaxID=36849 RepID=A0A0P8W945_9CLOT|nr:cyclic lactone autoinducer peptide [Oxobacter pfennigii]KPU44538.1 hypothetical protein OXPF_16210 [Oxobacter pfennigii]
MKKITRTIFTLAAAILTFAAMTSVANACAMIFYQPQVPAALREE